MANFENITIEKGMYQTKGGRRITNGWAQICAQRKREG